MPSRRFDGVNDSIHFNLPAACDLTGAVTILALMRRRTVGTVWHLVVGHHTTGNVGVLGFEFLGIGANAGAISPFNNTTQKDGATVIGNTTDWWLLGFSRAAGTSTPRIFIKNITTGVPAVKENANGTVGDAVTASGGTIRIGEYQGGDDLDANVAVVAGWNVALSDAQFDACYTNLRTSDLWTNAAGNPKYLWQFNQAATTDPVPDLAGNGATLAATNGTAVEADVPPGWSFDGTGSTGATVTALPATGLGSLPGPTVSEGTPGATVTAVPAAATGDVASPVQASIVIAEPASATGTLPLTVLAVEVTPGPCSATGALVTPVASTGGNTTVIAVPAASTGSLRVPSVLAGQIITAPPAAATGSSPVAALAAGANVTVVPGRATGSVLRPTVSPAPASGATVIALTTTFAEDAA